jgi:hypothetical protein
MTDQSTGAGAITICSIKGTDVRAIVNQIDFFESIYMTSTSCNLTMNDASGFSQKSALKGGTGEDVEISIGGRGGESIRMKFETAIAGDRVRTGQNQDMYLLTCASPEFIDDNKKSVDEALKDMKVSDIVKKVHDIYTKDSKTMKKDLVTNEETEDKQSYVGTGRSPSTVIRWACKEGKSAKAKASNYVYYQDRDGYHFKTIDSMLAEGPKMTLQYKQQNTGTGGDASKGIISFEQKKDFDSPQSSENGASSDHWYFYDPYTGKIDGVSDEKAKRDGPGDTTHSGKNQVTAKEKTDRGSRTNIIASPGGHASIKKSKFIEGRDGKVIENKRSIQEHAASSSAANQLDNLVMNIMVPGDTSIKPGIKVTLQIPASQENNELDNRSGDFLVTSVRHIIIKDDKDVKYNCILECKSDSQSKKAAGEK